MRLHDDSDDLRFIQNSGWKFIYRVAAIVILYC